MKKYFIALGITLFLSPVAEACKCAKDTKPEIVKDLLKVENAFVGHYKYKLLQVDRAWNVTPMSYDLKTDNADCALKFAENTRYLVLSTSTKSLDMCNTLTIALDKASKEMKLMGTRNPDPKNYNPNWFYCLKNDDCVVKKGPCLESVGIHKQFAPFYEASTKPSDKAGKCQPNLSKATTSTCVMNLCAVN
jgi:hypothetical protein